METSRPYKAIPSPSATKISALPKALGSSEVAPIAAGAAAATAIPPPMPAMPVDRAAAISPIPLAELAAAAAVGSVSGLGDHRHTEAEQGDH